MLTMHHPNKQSHCMSSPLLTSPDSSLLFTYISLTEQYVAIEADPIVSNLVNALSLRQKSGCYTSCFPCLYVNCVILYPLSKIMRNTIISPSTKSSIQNCCCSCSIVLSFIYFVSLTVPVHKLCTPPHPQS